MTYYVPGLGEKDPDKIIRAIQQAQEKMAALQATVATLPTTAVTNVATAGLATGGPITSTGAVTVTGAVKADQTTATSTAVAVTPAVQQNHPSAAKAWVSFTGSTGAILASYNVTSVTRNSAGDYTIAFTTSFSSAAYACVISTTWTGVTTDGGIQRIKNASKATGSVGVQNFTNFSTPAAADPVEMSVVCFGTQ